jgi:hypothetical protein
MNLSKAHAVSFKESTASRRIVDNFAPSAITSHVPHIFASEQIFPFLSLWEIYDRLSSLVQMNWAVKMRSPKAFCRVGDRVFLAFALHD